MNKSILDRLGSGEGLWCMAMTALGVVAVLLGVHKLSGAEFVNAFQIWAGAVFGSAAIAGFRDWKKAPQVTPDEPPK